MINQSDRTESILKQASSLRWQVGDDFHDRLSESIYADAADIAQSVQGNTHEGDYSFDRKLDKILTSRTFGFPIMIMILSIILWVTIQGANYPSGMLATLFLDIIYPLLKQGANAISMPWWLDGFLIDGVYLAIGWVIAVMLPPMAIFFPLFTLLEDFGYLPRVAFNLDDTFRRAGAHGKQALTMSMGWGCNAAGVVATRIIDSPRERLIAIITNNFSLCNGRWPTQILIATIFIGALVPSGLGGLTATASVIAIAMLGVFFTFFSSWLLSRTVLKGEVSTFALELPPYRPPRFWKTIYTSLIDRTLIVLWRAVVFAAPAGAVIWLISNIQIGDLSIANQTIDFLNPFAILLGLNGVILLAYIVAIPANEIVIPTILMLTVANLNMMGIGAGDGVMFELESTSETGDILRAGGWTLLTGINLMLFSLLHNPCSTTIYTIYAETKSWKWTTVATAMPVVFGLIVTFMVAQVWRIIENYF
ncbi:MAG: ferrous iron transporter B [Cyclobacteriaceae bacterium]